MYRFFVFEFECFRGRCGFGMVMLSFCLSRVIHFLLLFEACSDPLTCGSLEGTSFAEVMVYWV